jgi:hypothetical protein
VLSKSDAISFASVDLERHLEFHIPITDPMAVKVGTPGFEGKGVGVIFGMVGLLVRKQESRQQFESYCN